MKRNLYFLCIGLFLTFSAVAQTKKDDIKELLTLMGTADQYSKSFDAMIPIILQQNGSAGNDEMKEMLPIIKEESKNLIQKMMDTDITVIYDKYYTASEIKDLITFYKTPTGKKMVATAPEIVKEMTGLIMAKYLPDLQKRIDEKLQK